MQEIYNYFGGNTVEGRELDLLASIILLLVEETTSLQLGAM